MANYYNSNIVAGEFMNYEGQQDDDDFEKIIVNSGFSAFIRKVSAQDNSIVLPGFTFDIDGTQYVTDSNGETEKTPVHEMNSITDLDRVVITEISAPDGSYVKLRNPIWLYVRKGELITGQAEIEGIYINIVDGNQANPNTMYFNMKEATRYSFNVEDEIGNPCEVVLSVEKDPINLGNYIIEVEIENAVCGEYSLKIKKVDEKGNTIPDTRFDVVYGDLYDRQFQSIFTNENGIAEDRKSVV